MKLKEIRKYIVESYKGIECTNCGEVIGEETWYCVIETRIAGAITVKYAMPLLISRDGALVKKVCMSLNRKLKKRGKK